MPILYFLIAMLLITGGGAATTLFRGTPSTLVCQPNLELKEWVTVDIFPEKETLLNGAPLYKDKEGKLWVLIKRDAPIPAWKVWGGAYKKREGETLGEMEKAGVVLSSSTVSYMGKDVFVGLGHCNGVPGSTCTDPLVQDALFMVTKAGAKPPFSGCLAKWPDAASEECQKRPDYWWEFGVFLDASLLPPNPTNNNLPCWAKLACGKGDIMGENRKKVWEEFLRTGVCKAGEVLGAATDFPAFIMRTGINFTDPNFDKNKLVEVYWYKQEYTTNPLNVGAIEVGTYLYNSSSLAVLYLESGGVVFLSPLPDKDKFYAYEEIAKTVKPQGKSLQLGTFNPQRSLAYEWWTPACKPAIYLYPETPTQLSVKVKPKGRITVSDPEHGEDGWRVIAYPDGTIQLTTHNPSTSLRASPQPTTIYPYLYYEAELTKVKVPQEGWIVEKSEIKDFFDEVLPQLGLNEKEKQDFLSYWIPKLEEHLITHNSQPITHNPSAYAKASALGRRSRLRPTKSADKQLFIGLIDREELDRVEPIEFSIKPDTFIRIRFYFEKIVKDTFQVADLSVEALAKVEWTPGRWRNQKSVSDPRSQISPRRGFTPHHGHGAGFTAVDWGGILENGSCGIGEKSE